MIILVPLLVDVKVMKKHDNLLSKMCLMKIIKVMIYFTFTQYHFILIWFILHSHNTTLY